jgi:hypothetical protein
MALCLEWPPATEVDLPSNSRVISLCARFPQAELDSNTANQATPSRGFCRPSKSVGLGSSGYHFLENANFLIRETCDIQETGHGYFLNPAIFPIEKIMDHEKIISQLFASGTRLLDALEVETATPSAGQLPEGPDLVVELKWPRTGDRKRFVVEVKSQSTPKSVLQAIWQAKAYAEIGTHPLVAVPYLNEERLSLLEENAVSGIDLCGNGLITADNWLIRVTGNKNQYPASRPLQSPYAGKSALVGHLLLVEPRWQSVTQLQASIEERGAKLSMSQVSKALKALENDLVISRDKGVTLMDPARLLKGLARDFTPIESVRGHYLRTGSSPTTWVEALNQTPGLTWAVSGASSVSHHGGLSENGPTRLVVRDQRRAVDALKQIMHATDEPIRNFSDLELVENDAPGSFFNSELNGSGVRYASSVQTWLALQAGDARQQEAAERIRRRMLEDLAGCAKRVAESPTGERPVKIEILDGAHCGEAV